MTRDEQLERLRRALWVATPALLAAVVLYAYVGIGWYYFDRFSLDLGSQHFPAYRELHQLVISIVFGIPSIALLGVSMARLLATVPRLELALERFFDAEDRTWIAFTSLAALLVPIAIRMLCLDDKIIVDDEHLYRFEAQLIAGGHLTMPSPPLKLFYDQGYLINDGRMYAMYFIGWPVLMAPGVWLGIPGYMNALYCALTVPPIFLLLRALTSARWAKLGAVLYVASPILMVGAATQMSHTSGIFALAWMAWFVLKTTQDSANDQERAHWPWHVGVAAFFSLAFFIRPTVALGIGIPLLVAWALGMRDLLRNKALRDNAMRSLLAFGALSLVAAIAFLAVDKAQTGAFFTTAYARDKTYAVENGLRFSMWGVPGLVEYLATDPVPHFQTDRPFLACMAEWGIAMLRMNYNTFGWPFSLAFVSFARGRWAKILGWMFFTFSAIHFYVLAPGVDSYGPHHYIELALPILLLTILGAHRITETIGSQNASPNASEAKNPHVSHSRIPVTIVFAAIAFGLVTYMPPRALALVSMAENAHEPEYVAEKQGIHRAVIFSARPFASKFIGCAQASAQHNVYWHPLNAPSLDGDIVWVNHISVKDDKRLMKYYPDRRGLIMVWLPGCELRYLPIETMQPGDVTDGYIGGTEKGLDDSER